MFKAHGGKTLLKKPVLSCMKILVMTTLLIISNSVVFLGAQKAQTISSYGYILRPQKVPLALKMDNLYSLTDAQIKELAKYDLLITYATTYNKAAIEKLRSYNPDILILGYRNVAFIDERSNQEIEIARANGWVLKDANGNEVYEKNFNFLKLVDVGNRDYQAWLASLIKNRMSELVTMDGVFGDNTGALIDPYTVSSRPVNPRTGEVYQDNEWRDAMIELVRKIKNETAKIYIANGSGLFSGSGPNGFWQNKKLAESLVNTVDGVLLEGFIRWENEPWRTESKWKQDVEFLKYLIGIGKLAVAWIMCKEPPEGANQYQVAMFGYASYLLVISGDKCYFCAKGYMEEFYNITKIVIGTPLEDYHIRDDYHIYEREFSKVLILVNPLDKDIKLSLSRDFLTIDGEPIREVELRARSGLILVKISS